MTRDELFHQVLADRQIAAAVRQDRNRGTPSQARIRKALESGSSGPSNGRRLEMAEDRACQLAPHMGIGRACYRALIEHQVPHRDPPDMAELVSTLTVRVRARLKIALEPEPRIRRPKASTVPSARQTDHVMALVRALAAARGLGPTLATIDRLLNR